MALTLPALARRPWLFPASVIWVILACATGTGATASAGAVRFQQSGPADTAPSSVPYILDGDVAAWNEAFPVLMDDPTPPGCGAARGELLDLAWLGRCLGADISRGAGGEGTRAVELSSDQVAVADAVNRVNRALFDQGYVNSGVLIDQEAGRPSLNLVVGRLANSTGVYCALPTNAADPLTRAYAGQRLLASCDETAGFNLYLLERDFRLLADQRDPWIARVNMQLSPQGEPGLVTLSRGSDSGDLVSLQSRIQTFAGVANNRASSVGEVRSFASLTIRGPRPGMVVALTGGATDGALDAEASFVAPLSPRWRSALQANVNEAEIVDPRLRILDISSESQGADASLIFNAIRCPLTPIFGSGFDEVRRHAVALDGPGSCRLAGRMIGDSPVGWSSARDVTIGLTVSHRVSKTYLFGQPFSFSPGSVDGRASTTAIRLAVDWLERGRADRRSDLGWTIAARLEGTAGLDGTATDIAGLASPPTDFTVIRGAASFAAQIGDPDTVISARFSGQWTRDILYSSEKLSVGGVASVRGYEEASALTDRGVSGSIEASRTLSANTPRVRVGRAELDPFRFRASVFLDGAAGSDAGGATTRDVTILSAGVGLSWVPHEAVEIRAERGWRLINADLYNGLPNAGFHFNLEVQPLLFFGQ